MKFKEPIIKIVSSWPWPLPKDQDAITLYPFLLFRKASPSWRLLQHEMNHFDQVNKEVDKYGLIIGWLKFYGSYIVEHFKKGYRDNKYEVEARRKSDAEDK